MLIRSVLVSLVIFFNIPVFSQVDATFEIDTVSVSTREVILQSRYDKEDTLEYRFYWDLGDGNIERGPSVMHSYDKPGSYFVTLTVTRKEDMLVSSYSNEVTVSEELKVPNVFTPDGDGINDLFLVKSDGVTPLSITVFDRSGSVVFKKTAPVISWDGRTPSGILVRPGVYYYIIRSDAGIYNKTGFFHIFYDRDAR